MEYELEFRDVPDYPGYQVNQMGQVLHNDRVVRNIVGHGGLNRNKNSIRVIKKDGKFTNVPIAKLVALAFIGQPSTSSDVIKYKDGNSTNYSLSNIEWASRSEAYKELYNSKNRYCEDRLYMLRKKVCRPIEAYQKNDDKIVNVTRYNSITEAANDVHVATASIARCLKDSKAMSCGYYWRYVDKGE